MTVLAGTDVPFDAPFYNGTVGSTEVPGRLEVGVGGHGYMVDHAADLNGFRNEHFARVSTPVLRSQADTTNQPGEQSLNREGLWRRTQESFHHGAGQLYLDRASSDEYRFDTSKGVDVWTEWQLSLLPDTSQALSSANTNLPLLSVGTSVLVGDGNNVKVSSNITGGAPSWSTATGTPASSCQSLASDGTTAYAAFGANGIYSAASPWTTFASFVTGTVSLVGYVKGRLMAANANSIYNITAGGALPAALFTHPNSGFTWVGFAEGQGVIYAAGFAGTTSIIYRITIQPDGTALSAPVPAGGLPTGEIIRSIKCYLGSVVVGTDLGFRLGSPDSAGNITFGPLITTTSPVKCFEPYDRFIWYGLSNYDATSTGLGRMDLSVFTQSLAPAYASDLMATGQGTVNAVVTQNAMRVFTVSGLGVYVQSANKVPTGTLTTGRMSYGVVDDKLAMFVDLRHEPLAGSVSASLSANNGTPSVIGTSSTAGTIKTSFALNAQGVRGEYFEVTLTLTRDAVTTTGPTVTRYTLRSLVTPTRTYEITVPLILQATQIDLNGATFQMDVAAERVYLESLVNGGTAVTFQEASRAYSVVVEDCTWVPIKTAFQQTAVANFDGTMILKMREVPQ